MNEVEIANVQLAKIGSIKKNPNNPRHIRKDKLEKLQKSLSEFPDMLRARPIVVDEDFMVLGGNMRLQAAKSLGLKEVYIVQVKGWTPKQKNEFVIKDNASFGEWDYDLLANEWDSEVLVEWGVDVWTQPEEADYRQEDSESEEKEPRAPKGTDDDYSVFELIMLHENKMKLIEVLSKIRTNLGFHKNEEALMHLINNYKE